MDTSSNKATQGLLQVPGLQVKETSKVSLRGSCQVLKSPSEIARQKALTNSKNQCSSSCKFNNNLGSGCASVSGVVVPEEGSVENILEIDFGKDGEKDVKDGAESFSSFQNISPLCKVDQVIDFWVVDDELMGRFHISSCPSKSDPIDLQHQRAVIFKVKTTSPYNSWVSPVVGLMRPNVVCTVDVKCDAKASRSSMSQDQFVVEIASVPGASAEMTSDLYTSAVSSNIPELLNIWEKIESDIKSDPVTNHSKEYHKIACRFRRAPLKSAEDVPKKDKEACIDDSFNSNVKTFQFQHEDTPIWGVSHDAPKLDVYMAREKQDEGNCKTDKRTSSLTLNEIARSQARQRAEAERRWCSTVSKLKIINLTLACLLIISIGFVVYLSPIAIPFK